MKSARGYLSYSVSLALASGLLLPATAAIAQGGGAADSLEEVVVTARKREENLQDLALSVSALSAGEIQANFATDVRDLIYMSPNTVLDDTNQGPGGVAAAYEAGDVPQQYLPDTCRQ